MTTDFAGLTEQVLGNSYGVETAEEYSDEQWIQVLAAVLRKLESAIDASNTIQRAQLQEDVQTLDTLIYEPYVYTLDPTQTKFTYTAEPQTKQIELIQSVVGWFSPVPGSSPPGDNTNFQSIAPGTTAIGAGAVLNAGQEVTSGSLTVIAAAGTTAGVVQLQASLDGINFFNVGTPITLTAAGTFQASATGLFQYLRAAITTTVAGGSVTAFVGYAQADTSQDSSALTININLPLMNGLTIDIPINGSGLNPSIYAPVAFVLRGGQRLITAEMSEGTFPAGKLNIILMGKAIPATLGGALG